MTATINASTSAGVVTTADTSGILQLQTNGTAALTVDASQNVGIGTSSPNGKLAVIPSANPTTVATSTTLTLGEATNNSAYQLRMAYSSLSSVFTGVIDAVQNSLGAPLALNPTGGNVGIGTTSPTRALSVVGTWTNTGDYLMDSGSPQLAWSSGDLRFKYGGLGGTEAMRINASGQVLINQTADFQDAKLEITGDGSNTVLAVKQSTTSSVTQLSFNNPNGVVGQISTSGSATSYVTSSDYRLKEAITPMTGALAKVIALKPCTYKWKVDGSDGQGFIAHELDEVVPGCVTGEKDAVQEEQYEVTPAVKDEEGNIVTEAVMGTRTVPKYQGIDTSFLVATLTAAIQELKAIVDAQGAEIAALKGATA
jgi:hypothetical protein